jgi:tetratricopeptide (TPR) repeat protein
MRADRLAAYLGATMALLFAATHAASAKLNLALIGCEKQTVSRDLPCILRIDPVNERSIYHLGLNALRGNNVGQAIELFRRDLGTNPHDVLAGYFLGVAYRRLGNESAAMEVWRRSGSREAFTQRAWQKGAIEDFQTAISLGETDARTFYKFGDVLFEHGELQRAREVYKGGLARDPQKENAASLLVQGRVTELEGGRVRSIAMYTRAAALQPEDPTAYLRIANVYGQLHATAQSEAWCRRCISATGAVAGYLCAADANRTAGNYRGAIDWAERARKRFPEDSAVFISLARSYEAANDPKAADRAYAEAGRLQPADFWIPYYRSDLASRAGDTQQAMHFLEQSIHLNPSSAYLYVQLGNAYTRLERVAAACRAYSAALRLETGNSDAIEGVRKSACQNPRAADRIGNAVH